MSIRQFGHCKKKTRIHKIRGHMDEYGEEVLSFVIFQVENITKAKRPNFPTGGRG